VDVNGKRGFVLTLQAREQHIRREKATSNICSNEALCALAVSVYLATVGKEGFAEVAGQSMAKAHYAAEQLAAQGILLAFKAPFFQEFVVKVPGNIAEINEKLYAKKIIGGLDLGQYYPELAEHMLIAVTEKRTKQEIDALVASMGVR
jgi:glycine dehydrogenase subunit 1